MRCLSILIIAVLLLFGCSRKENKSVQVAKEQVSQRDSIEAVGLKALTALQAKNYDAFAALFHPIEGVRFSGSSGKVGGYDLSIYFR